MKQTCKFVLENIFEIKENLKLMIPLSQQLKNFNKNNLLDKKFHDCLSKLLPDFFLDFKADIHIYRNIDLIKNLILSGFNDVEIYSELEDKGLLSLNGYNKLVSYKRFENISHKLRSDCEQKN